MSTPSGNRPRTLGNDGSPPRRSDKETETVALQAIQGWEYAQLINPTMDQINDAGRKGWRLVGSPTSKIVFGSSGKMVYTFERPLPLTM